MPTPRAKGAFARGDGTVLARVVSDILTGAAREGLPREALVEAAGLNDLDLDNPDARVPVWAYVALWQLIARRTADPATAIRMGAAVPARHWGLVGYAMSYSTTLGGAIRRLVRYGRIVNDAIELRLEKPTSDHVTITAVPLEVGVGLPHAVNYRVAMLLASSREITRTEVVPSEVALAYDAPPSTLGYHRFFRSPVRFGQPRSGITFRESDLDLPIPRGDEVLAGYLSDGAERVLHTLFSGTSTVERARSAIWAMLSEGPPTLHRIAAALEVSPRTLQRRLAAEGTTLHREIEHIRKQMAVATLRERAIPIEEVAFILGYAEPSTFYRSFKRWTGETPHQYRAANSRQPPPAGVDGRTPAPVAVLQLLAHAR